MGTLLGSSKYSVSEFRGDALGGITVGVLMLPIGMGYGVISGLGPAAGLNGTIAVCLFAALFGGTRGLISGPSIFVAVSMGIIVAEYTTTLAEALTAVMLAGLLQIVFGVLMFGRYASYTPYSMLAGFFTAAGILLIVTQSVTALGSGSVGGGFIGHIQALPEVISGLNPQALALAAGTIILGLAWPRRLGSFAPAPFVVLVVGTAVGAFWLTEAPVIGEITSGVPQLQAPVFSLELFLRVLEPAFMMALLNAVVTLIVALYADSLTGGSHKPNQELVSQGIANLAAGAIGGAPGGSFLVATLVNINSGGRSRVAGLIAAGVLLVALFGLNWLLEKIPYAVLAGILITNGWAIIDKRFLYNLRRIPRGYVFAMLTTTVLAVVVDFVTAVLIGLVIAAFISPNPPMGGVKAGKLG